MFDNLLFELVAPFHFRSLKARNFGLMCDRFCGAAAALKFYMVLMCVDNQSCKSAVTEQAIDIQ